MTTIESPTAEVQSLIRAREGWRQRVLHAEARLASTRRRLRLCRRSVARVSSQHAALLADLGELEQQAAAALAGADEYQARELAIRIRGLDTALQQFSRRQTRLSSRERRLLVLKRCWQWRIEQHRRADQRRPVSLARSCSKSCPWI